MKIKAVIVLGFRLKIYIVPSALSYSVALGYSRCIVAYQVG